MTDQIIDEYYAADEIARRLPEVSLIDDGDVYDSTMDALRRGVPEYFWHVPASSSGKYHNPFCRGKHGLWVHVKQCVTAFERLAHSEGAAGTDSLVLDEARAALLVHDMLKYGHSYEDGDHTTDEHAELTATWLEHNSDLSDAVVSAVRSHAGPWAPTGSIETDVDRLVHYADMVASDPNITVGVYQPSEELRQRYPNLPRADLE